MPDLPSGGCFGAGRRTADPGGVLRQRVSHLHIARQGPYSAALAALAAAGLGLHLTRVVSKRRSAAPFPTDTRMQRDRVAGIALIAGALVPLLIIGLHPTAHDLASDGAARHQALVNRLVHSVMLAAQPVLFLGLLGLSRQLGWSPLPTAALVVYGFGIAAVLSAAVVSGFVAPGVIERMASAESGAEPTYQALLVYSGLLNQGFAKVYVVSSGVAFMLWSAAIWATGRLSRAAAVLGLAAGTALALGVVSGHLRLNVHGIIVVTLLQALWLVVVGGQLFAAASAAPPTCPASPSP